MKRRMRNAMAAGVMACSVLCMGGCQKAAPDTETTEATGAAEATETTEATEETEKAETAKAWDGDVSHVVMTYITLGTTPAAMEKVEDAVNEITIPDIGVEVEFKPVSAFDCASQYGLWISSHETVDLMMIMFQNLTTYSSQGMLMPLDDLLAENAPYISASVEEGYPLYDGSYYMDETYGVGLLGDTYGTNGAYLMEKKYLDGAEITCDEDAVYTLDQLTEIFAAVKGAYPDVYPCGILTTGAMTSSVSYWNMPCDILGNSPSTGVLMGTDSTEIVNLFATEEYYDLLKHIKEWYDAGYIYPDAATTSSTCNELLLAGTLAGIPRTGAPGMKSDMEKTTGEEFVQIPLCDPYYGAASSLGVFWTVPVTAENPEAAIRFLDYTYSNHELNNLIQWGIEGEHYVVLDEEKNLIGFPDNVDGNSSTYYNTLGLYGDRRYVYVWDASISSEYKKEYSEKALGKSTQGVGYLYNTTRMQTEIANVDAVLAQYIPTLESGSCKDLDSLYQEFLDALDKAGINEIIADNQAQFDAWRLERE